MAAANWHRCTETRSVEECSPDPHTYQKGLKLLRERRREDCTPGKLIHKDHLESPRIHLKRMQIDPQRSATVCKDLLKTPAIRSVIISLNLQRFTHNKAQCHTSEHLASCHKCFGGNPLTPVRQTRN